MIYTVRAIIPCALDLSSQTTPRRPLSGRAQGVEAPECLRMLTAKVGAIEADYIFVIARLGAAGEVEQTRDHDELIADGYGAVVALGIAKGQVT